MSLGEAVARRLISPHEPLDAVAAYYAWWHEGAQLHAVVEDDAAALFISADSPHGLVGIVRANDPALVPRVLALAPPGRRYVMTREALAAAVPFQEASANRVFWLAGEPNVPAGPVGEAVCTVLWQSPHFAELQVETPPAHRGRGFAKAAVGATAARLLAGGVRPLYIASVGNEASLRVARAVGFTPCTELEIAGYVESEG